MSPCSRTSTIETRSTLATSAMRWTTVKRMPRKSRFEASAWVSSRTTCASRSFCASSSIDAAQAKLPADPRDELDGLEGLAHEVVRPGLERLRDLVVRVEGGQHDDRQIARLGARAQDAQDLVAVRRRHHEVEQHERRCTRRSARAPRCRIRPRRGRSSALRKRLDEHVTTYRVVVDDEDGSRRSQRKCTRLSRRRNDVSIGCKPRRRRTSLARTRLRPLLSSSARTLADRSCRGARRPCRVAMRPRGVRPRKPCWSR